MRSDTEFNLNAHLHGFCSTEDNLFKVMVYVNHLFTEEYLLSPTKISSLEYELEAESNAGSALSIQSLPTPPPLITLSFSSPPPSYKMS